jgi:hypothetical protein
MIFLTLLFLRPLTGGASSGFVLKGRIIDAGGKPAEGGEVFVYDTPRTKRPADFISPMADREGLYRMVLPPGRYWVVARVRSGERYGPLLTGGRHSGEAVEVEAAEGGEVPLDFTVADVREMARNQRKTGEDYRRVEGRIVDRNGRPVRNAYAFARKEKDGSRLPDFISAWSDEGGGYTLYLPAGRSCLGAAVAYPPEDGVLCTELFLDSATIDIVKDFQLNYIDINKEQGDQNSKEID